MNMNNVTKVVNEPAVMRQVGEMEPGEMGYTIPWAYNKELRRLDETAEFTTFRAGTISTLFVKCVEKGKYEIEFT